jgi:hypothetical protein
LAVWRVFAGLLVLVFTSAGAEPAVTFPGPANEARAPSGGMAVTYFDPGANEHDFHEYSLKLQYPDGRSDEVLVFTRTAEVSWSPDGKAFSVTNHITDDVADCYVVTPGSGRFDKISLTEVVTKGRYPAPAWALQHSAHAAVTCDGWTAPDKLRFALEGAGGDSPRGFHYAFVYDTTRDIVVSPAKGKSRR